MIEGLMIENPYIIENENFCVFATQSLKEMANASFDELNLNKKRILDFFQLKKFRKVSIIQFDNRENFRKFVLSLRGPGAHLPEYAQGVFDKGMSISFIDLKIIKDENVFIEKAKINVHEFIHIVNREKIYKERVVWLDEGLATNLDGKRELLKEKDKFIEFLNNKILSIKVLPEINDLSHKGQGFKQEFYDGYDLVYLSVRYLLETKNKNKLFKILKDNNLAIKVGKTVLKDAINYYKDKLSI